MNPNFVAFIALSAMLSGLITGFVAGKTEAHKLPVTIPFAAAEEARIVCTHFGGLHSFSLKAGQDLPQAGPSTPQAGASAPQTPGPALTPYVVSAACLSGHRVTGQIHIDTQSPKYGI